MKKKLDNYKKGTSYFYPIFLIIFILITLYLFIFGDNGTSTPGGLIASVPAVAFAIFLNMLEILVGAIQAYVFTLLSAIYFGMATEEHH